MTKPYNVTVVGRGGQGVIFLARVLGEAALRQGTAVRVTESHGMAMRGGSVATSLRIGAGLSPLFRAGTGDLLLAVDARETAAGLPSLSPAGRVLVNSDAGGAAADLPSGALAVDADGIARAEGVPRSANLALLGAAGALPGFPVGRAALEEAVAARSRPAEREQNLAILRRGAAAALCNRKES
jgi:indolepyruvate ferredoxin oxidoreductase, beta subunit